MVLDSLLYVNFPNDKCFTTDKQPTRFHLGIFHLEKECRN